MIVNTKRVVGTRVETKTGDAVGKVASIDLDADTGRLHTLWVKTRGISGLLEDELAVSWNAIVSFSEERVVIADATISSRVAVAVSGVARATPTLMKEG